MSADCSVPFYLMERARLSPHIASLSIFCLENCHVFQRYMFDLTHNGNIFFSCVRREECRSIILADVNKSRISLTAHYFATVRWLVTRFKHSGLFIYLFIFVLREWHRSSVCPARLSLQHWLHLLSPCGDFFFFKLQAPLTGYLHPSLIYAIKGSIAVCLIHSFILLCLSLSRSLF